jgi:hypothetical protein
MTQMYPYNHANVVRIARKKNRTGTKATLFVSAKKSAAVSIMRIDTAKLLRLHARQRQ